MSAEISEPYQLTELLTDWCNGDGSAADKLFPLVYHELKRIARRHLRNETPRHTLQTTALVNEAYLRLVDQKSRARLKRGGDICKISLDEAAAVSDGLAAEMLALDEALQELARIDTRRSQVVELRFFGGLSNAEIAEVLKVAPNTVIRDWNMARAWLYHELSGQVLAIDEK
jgi:DNA-directed RNA polymerase specialized sigma24 family protein